LYTHTIEFLNVWMCYVCAFVFLLLRFTLEWSKWNGGLWTINERMWTLVGTRHLSTILSNKQSWLHCSCSSTNNESNISFSLSLFLSWRSHNMNDGCRVMSGVILRKYWLFSQLQTTCTVQEIRQRSCHWTNNITNICMQDRTILIWQII
jgi:hypothetical protein